MLIQSCSALLEHVAENQAPAFRRQCDQTKEIQGAFRVGLISKRSSTQAQSGEGGGFRINQPLGLIFYCWDEWASQRWPDAWVPRMLNARIARLLSTGSCAVLLALSVAGCKTTRTADVTGSIPASASMAAGDSGAADAWATRYRANPGDPAIAVSYAQTLRARGLRAQAAAVLEQAAIRHPKNMAVLGAYGRALADNGDFKQALEVLGRAHTPEQPDWRILSVQGAVLDQMGRHGDAQRHYMTALKIAPEEPTVLSNLGLSYVLSKKLDLAEQTLRRAAARPQVDPRVRQNLALVVGLRGRFAEAESIAKSDLPPEEAAANVAYLKQMLAKPDAAPNAGPSRTAQVSAAHL